MSLFFPESKALFLHIPRTGGASVGKLIRTCEIPFDKMMQVGNPMQSVGEGHLLLLHLGLDFLEQVEYIFTFVRHPFDYYVSIWRFITRSVQARPRLLRKYISKGGNSSLKNEALDRWKPDFNEWLEEMLEEEPGWVTRWYERFVGPEDKEFVHFIGRTETLKQDIEEVMKILGYEEEWKAGQKSRMKVKRMNQIEEDNAVFVELTDEQKRRIERSERVSIRRFFGEETVNKRIYRNQQGISV